MGYSPTLDCPKSHYEPVAELGYTESAELENWARLNLRDVDDAG
jgi:hypothetical protein